MTEIKDGGSFQQSQQVAFTASITEERPYDVESIDDSRSDVMPALSDHAKPVQRAFFDKEEDEPLPTTYIMNYLREHSCFETERMFVKELERLGKPVPRLPDDQNETVKSFGRFVSFVQSFQIKSGKCAAQDCYAELSQFFYPCIIYLYLHLIGIEKQDEAKNLLVTYSSLLNTRRHGEFTQLASIHRKEDAYHFFPTRLFAQSVWPTCQKDPELAFKSRFVIRISASAYKILKDWLTVNKVPAIMPCFQEWTFIDVINSEEPNDEFGEVASFRPGHEVRLYSGGLIGEPLVDMNRNRVYYGLLNSIRKQHSDNSSSPSDYDPESPQKRNGRKSSGNGSTRIRGDSNAPPSSRRIPLPEQATMCRGSFSPFDKIDEVLSSYLDAEESLNPTLPSVCMYTVIQPHSEAICATFCDDKLAVGFDDGYICLWALLEEKPLRKLKSADLLDELDAKSPSVYDALFEEGSERQSYTLVGHESSVHCLDFSSCGGMLLSGGSDCTIRLWSTFTMTCLVVYRGHCKCILDVKFSPYDHYFASVGRDRSARLWVQDQIHSVRIFSDEDHLGDVLCVQFHPNCHYIATGCEDRYVRLYDLAVTHQMGWHRACVRTFSGHKAPVQAVQFTDCGHYLISAGGEDGIVCIFDLTWTASANTAPAYIVNVLSDPTAGATCSFLSISPDGRQLAVAGDVEGSVRVWDLCAALDRGHKDNTRVTQGQVPFLLTTQFTKSTPILAIFYIAHGLIFALGRLDVEDHAPSDSNIEATHT